MSTVSDLRLHLFLVDKNCFYALELSNLLTALYATWLNEPFK